MKPECVPLCLAKHLEECYGQQILLFDMRGSLPSTVDIGSGADHGQGAFSHTLAAISQIKNQATKNQLFITKADQKDYYEDLLEMTGHYAPVFKSRPLRRTGQV